MCSLQKTSSSCWCLQGAAVGTGTEAPAPALADGDGDGDGGDGEGEGSDDDDGDDGDNDDDELDEWFDFAPEFAQALRGHALPRHGWYCGFSC
jgi:hypothetical protein